MKQHPKEDRMLKERLKRLRKKHALTQSALATRLGVTQQAVAKWESGRSVPDHSLLLPLSEIYGVSADYLLGAAATLMEDSVLPCGDFALVPVVGTVKAGFGREAFEDISGSHPAEVRDPEDYFYLIVQGDSMEPRIRAGDLALVRRQNTLQNGDLGVLVLRGGEGTLKRFFMENGAVRLESFNPSSPALEVSGEDLNELFILGRVVETKTRW
jgi:repressor LexA